MLRMSLPVVPTGFLSKTHVFNPFLQNDRVESFSLLDVTAVERYMWHVFHFAHSDERPGTKAWTVIWKRDQRLRELSNDFPRNVAAGDIEKSISSI